MHAVTDQQMYPGLLAIIDHFLSLFGIQSHRLFHNHMLACASNLNGIVFMQSIRRSDIHRIHFLVVFDLIDGRVIIAARLRDLIFLAPGGQFSGCPTHQSGNFNSRTCLNRLGHHIAISSQAHQSYPQNRAIGH